MKETDIQKQCLEWLHAKGIFCWRQNQAAVPLVGGGFRRFSGMKGVSDILGMFVQYVDKTPMGLLLAIEVKMPKKKPSPEQTQFLQEVNTRGGIGLCVHSLDELVEGLAEYE